MSEEMENKLCVGMYVRTKYGIRKIEKIEIINNHKFCRLDQDYISDEPEHHYEILEDEIIGEPSFAIADLIRVEDYVNGELIEDITGEYLRVNGESHNKFYFSKQIKSIVTREQFEQMSYKVGV